MIFLKCLRYATIIFFMVLSFRSVAESSGVKTLAEGKAHYIIEVVKHITLPNESQIDRFNITILGSNKHLLKALRNKASNSIRGKSISIVQRETLDNADANIDVIFVSRFKSAFTAEIKKRYKNVLIISENSADKESLMVGLTVIRNDIKLTLNRENLIKQGFKISNGMLDFAGTKADLREQLDDRENTLNKVLREVAAKESQLKELNTVLDKNQQELQQIQLNLKQQNKQLIQAQQQLTQAQQQLSILETNKEAVMVELKNKQNNLLAQHALLTAKEQEHAQQQKKLTQLNINIAQAEQKLAMQLEKLKQQSEIIASKKQQITDQRKLLYLTIALILVILVLMFVALRISSIRKQANEELANLNKKLYQLATTDDMTKLFNRRHFLELAQRELSQLQRTRSSGAVLMIDIDHFKNINDSHGHAAGDQALIGVANILNDNLRDYDIVGRVGGEEFAMFLPNCDIETATHIAERIREKIAELTISFQEVSIKLTISIGLTAILVSDNDIGLTINRADKALYQAKDSGRNTVILH